jgi:hypothetical protein
MMISPVTIFCRGHFILIVYHIFKKPECDKVIEGIVLTVSVPVKHNIRPFRKCFVYVVIVA